jgi:hypothetical protein
MQRFDSEAHSLSILRCSLIIRHGANSLHWRVPHERPVKNRVTIRSSGFEKSPVQNRFKNYFALTFVSSFEMRETDRFFSWGAMRF